MKFLDRVKHAWNAFNGNQSETYRLIEGSWGSATPSFKAYRYSKGSIIDTIVTRIAIDVSMVNFEHVKMDGDQGTENQQPSGLNRCLTLEANIDQSYIDFMQDIVFSMMDEGVCAVVPVDTKLNPNRTSSYDILSMRVGRIKDWYPKAVRVRLYNDRTGEYEEVVVSKSNCAILQNPLYSIINADNSTLKRLMRKLAILDSVDENLSNNKLDLLIQLPYIVKNEIRKQQADERIKAIEDQLKNSKYGVAYIDGTEKVVQLNRSVENNLLKEIEYLTTELFNQLGLTKAIFDGTASEQEIRSYYDRTINPIAKQIALEFTRKFLTDTARTQGHSIVYHSSIFQLVPISVLAGVADTLRRNEIVTTNEIRKLIGLPLSDDPRANELFNPNIADTNQMMGEPPLEDEGYYEEGDEEYA